MNFISLYLQAYIQNLAEDGPVVTEKQLYFYVSMTLGKGQEMTLTVNTYILINTIIFRSKAAILFEKSTFPTEVPKLQNLTLS